MVEDIEHDTKYGIIEKLNRIYFCSWEIETLSQSVCRETNFSCRCSFLLTRTNISWANNEFWNSNFHRDLFSFTARDIIYIKLYFNLQGTLDICSRCDESFFISFTLKRISDEITQPFNVPRSVVARSWRWIFKDRCLASGSLRFPSSFL